MLHLSGKAAFLPLVAGLSLGAFAYDTHHMDPVVCMAKGQPVLLYNPTYKLYMFVSNDMDGQDHVVEAHQYQDEPRNRFVLKPGSSGGYKLYNPTYGLYLFLRNGKDSQGDRHLFAHKYADEPRNEFELQAVGGGAYRLYSPTYKYYLFVSNDKKSSDNVVEGHGYPSEERNHFAFQLATEPTASQLRWHVDSGKLMSQKPSIVQSEELTVPAGGSVSFQYSHSLAQGSSFQYSLGFEISEKGSFSTGIPVLAGGKIEISATLKHSWTWGKSNTETWSYSGTTNLVGTPYQLLIGKAVVRTAEMEIPYTATWVTTDGMTFDTEGTWKGTTCFDIVAYGDDSASWGRFVEETSGDTMMVGFRKGIVFYKGSTSEELGRVPDSILAGTFEYDFPWGHRWMTYKPNLNGTSWWIERTPGDKRWRLTHESRSDPKVII